MLSAVVPMQVLALAMITHKPAMVMCNRGVAGNEEFLRDGIISSGSINVVVVLVVVVLVVVE